MKYVKESRGGTIGHFPHNFNSLWLYGFMPLSPFLAVFPIGN